MSTEALKSKRTRATGVTTGGAVGVDAGRKTSGSAGSAKGARRGRVLFSGDALERLRPHPLAKLIPPMPREDRDALKARIAADGRIHDPAVIHEGMLLDGNNRASIAAELGLPLPALHFDPAWGSPLSYVIAKNTHRNFTDSMKAVAAEQLLPKLRAETRRQRGAGRARDEAAGLFGVSGRYVELARYVRRRSPSVYRRVCAGELELSRARGMIERRDRLRDMKARAAAAPPASVEWRVIVGDCVAELRKLPDGAARVVFTDPPYNIGLHYDGDATGDKLNPEDYVAWSREWMAQAARVLAEDGTLYVVISDAYADVLGVALRELHLHRQASIYWWENFPNHTDRDLPSAMRPILRYTKSPGGGVFNADSILQPSRRIALGDSRGVEGGNVPPNVWPVNRLPGNARDRVPFAKAPPQIPDEIPRRCILVASNPGDLVVDPFNGNGTTGAAAVTCGRRYVGIEQSRRYARQSEQWIRAAIAAAGENAAA